MLSEWVKKWLDNSEKISTLKGKGFGKLDVFVWFVVKDQKLHLQFEALHRNQMHQLTFRFLQNNFFLLINWILAFLNTCVLYFDESLLHTPLIGYYVLEKQVATTTTPWTPFLTTDRPWMATAASAGYYNLLLLSSSIIWI